jgi:putative nucleotidyltransferase with HDIG domain
VHDHSLEDIAFFDMYTHSVDTIGTLFDEMRTSKKVPLQGFQTVAEGILEQVLEVQGVLNRLRQVKSGDEYTYNHSLNVGIYAVLIGSWLGYDDRTLRQLAMAGLLHDVGKANVPLVILQKPASLTSAEFDVMKKHTIYGYQLVCNTAGLSRQVAMAVLQHHEREDGTGYPLKLNSRQIHPLAKIVAVADVYDAVTSNRVYRVKKTPYIAADIIMEESFKTLDPIVVQKFLEQITTYFFTDKVRLNTGVTGKIISINPLRPTRPLIQTDDGFIDLQTTPTLQIVEVL